MKRLAMLGLIIALCGCNSDGPTPSAAALQKPASPSKPIALKSSDSAYTVSWAPVSGAHLYHLQERHDGGAWIEVHASQSTYQAFGAKPPGLWEYRVRACGDIGCGDYSPLTEIRVSG